MMVRSERTEPSVEEKKAWETPRLAVEGRVSEITAATSIAAEPPP